MAKSPQQTVELQAHYAAQVVADLDRVTQEQERMGNQIAALQDRLRALDLNHAVLEGLRTTLAVESSRPAPSTTPAPTRPRKSTADPGRVVLLVAEVVGDLPVEGGLQHTLGQPLQQPALAGQLQPARAGPVDQLPDQLLVQDVGRQLDRTNLFNRLSRDDHVTHQVLFLDRELHR